MAQEITSFNFNFEKGQEAEYAPHLAVTLSDLEGAASGYNTALLMKKLDENLDKDKIEQVLLKAKQELETTMNLEQQLEKAKVSVEMSFQDFLYKFFGLYSTESDMLAMMLGMYEPEEDSEVETYEDYLADKASAVTIMKSLKDSNELDKDFNNLSIEDRLSVYSLQKSFEQYLGKQESSVASDEDTVVQSDVNLEKSKEEMMDFKELLKSEEMQDLLATVKSEAIAEFQKSAEAEKKDLEGQVEELVKAKRDAEAAAEQVKVEAETEKANELVKSLSFVAEDSQEALVKALVENRNAEGISEIVKAFDAAKVAIEAVALEKATEAPEGSEKEAEITNEKEVSGLMKGIQSVNAKKESK